MKTTRRGLLTMGALSALGWATLPRTALGAVSMQAKPSHDGALVTIFLRGGADGLSLVSPYGDEDYFRRRPTLAIPSPRDGRAAAKDRAADLDGFFGLHPGLNVLLPLYQSGQMAIVHACGSDDQTRSHFEAMATMERGLARETGPASGWLARHLGSAPWENSSPLRAVALGEIMPQTLRGATNATAMESVADLALQVPVEGRAPLIHETLGRMYAGADGGDRGLLRQAGREALSVLRILQSLSPAQYQPAHGAAYPKDDLGNGLRQVALLMKSNVGLEAAFLDHGGYDTHVAQGGSGGYLAARLRSLGGSIAAFAADLGPARWARATVVVLSEFGRRVEENSGAGTDHGRGGALFVLGGAGIAGGRVHGAWPTLASSHLDGPGDLHVTTDYRNVLAEVISRRVGNPRIDSIFPGLDYRPIGIAHG